MTVMAKKKSDPHWMEKAASKMKAKGTVGSFGHHSMKTINKDIAKGGKLGKKAAFAKAAKSAHHKKKSG